MSPSSNKPPAMGNYSKALALCICFCFCQWCLKKGSLIWCKKYRRIPHYSSSWNFAPPVFGPLATPMVIIIIIIIFRHQWIVRRNSSMLKLTKRLSFQLRWRRGSIRQALLAWLLLESCILISATCRISMRIWQVWRKKSSLIWARNQVCMNFYKKSITGKGENSARRREQLQLYRSSTLRFKKYCLTTFQTAANCGCFPANFSRQKAQPSGSTWAP